NIAAQSLGNPSLFEGKEAVSSNESVASATASSSAQTGSFNIRVNNLALTDQISSDLFTSPFDELNYSGNFIVNGSNISITASDSLSTIATKITGANAGVKASVVQIAPNQNKLVLGATNTGVDKIELREVGDANLLSSLGLVNNDPAQASYDYTVNADTYGALGDTFDLADVFSTNGKSFTVSDAGGQHTMTVDFSADMTLEQIRDRINTVSSNEGANISAELVEDGGQYRLRINSETGIPNNFSDPDNVLFDLGIANGIQSEDFGSSVKPLGSLLNLGETDTYTIELSDGDGSNPISVDVDLDTDSLNDIKEKLNTAIGNEVGSDLEVNIISVNGRSRLEIKSASGQPVLNSATDNGNIFETLGLVDTQFKNYDQQGENSQFEFNGVKINRESNLVTDLAEGVSLALNNESSELVTININEDHGDVSGVIDDFVSAYNSVIDFINENTFYDTQTKDKGLLFGESTIRSVESMLSAKTATLVPIMPSAKISELNGGEGIQLGKIEIVDRAGNETVVDLTGVQTVQDILDTINLTDGLQVRAEVNINGNSLNLVDESGGFGALQVKEVDGGSTAADLGFQGQIYSEQMFGSIIFEGGTTNLSEIGIETTGTGSLSFNSTKLTQMLSENPDKVKNLLTADNVGFIDKFRESMKSYTAYGTGILDSQTKAITDRIESYNNQIKRYQERAANYEVTLRRQFTALEVAMAESQQMSDFLAQKLNAQS
ncbi:flagellar filament capping protein FliD, partial [bacterium]|nr:flagellar filament capping protein FliD [bacterium]